LATSAGPPVPGTPSLLRAINDRAALELLLERGPLSRAEIGALTGLSKPTASQLLARLKQAGLVVLEGRREGQRGPSAELYAVNPAAAYVAGLDVTSERIQVAVADVTGRVLARHELPTPPDHRGDGVACARAALLGALAPTGLAMGDLRRVVIGTPGAIDPDTGQLEYAPELVRWQGPGLLARLQAGLGVPVDVENDVNVVAMAEYDHGAARGAPAFALLWVSEGIGLAYVQNGVPHRGATGGAGEVGYMPVPGQPVYRDVRETGDGGYQCLAGGPAVRRLLREHGFTGRDAATAVGRAVAALATPNATPDAGPAAPHAGPTTPHAGPTPPHAALATPDAGPTPPHAGPGGKARPAAHAQRAERAAAALDELASRLATGLAAITAVLDPGLVVLAGDVLLAGAEPLRSRLQAELHTIGIGRPRLALCSADGNPVLLGALHLALSAARKAVFGRAAP
jgi:predicted NBD/HSP70 family sugar kinase